MLLITCLLPSKETTVLSWLGTSCTWRSRSKVDSQVSGLLASSTKTSSSRSYTWGWAAGNAGDWAPFSSAVRHVNARRGSSTDAATPAECSSEFYLALV